MRAANDDWVLKDDDKPLQLVSLARLEKVEASILIYSTDEETPVATILDGCSLDEVTPPPSPIDSSDPSWDDASIVPSEAPSSDAVSSISSLEVPQPKQETQELESDESTGGDGRGMDAFSPSQY